MWNQITYDPELFREGSVHTSSRAMRAGTRFALIKLRTCTLGKTAFAPGPCIQRAPDQAHSTGISLVWSSPGQDWPSALRTPAKQWVRLGGSSL